jgi:hypothetical protein
MNEGFSGEGNAIFVYPENDIDYEQILAELPLRLRIVASDLSFRTFMEKFMAYEGIAEEFY